jgi:thymidylate synthase
MREWEPCFVKATTIEDAYFQLLHKLWKIGFSYQITNGSSAGAKRLEFCHASGLITVPHQNNLAPIFPEGSSIPPVTTNEKIHEYFANYLMNPEHAVNEHYKYADWICGYVPKTTEQLKGVCVHDDMGMGVSLLEAETPIEWVIRHFKEKGFGNNHCYINIGDLAINWNYDIPYEHETERRTSPCLRGISFKIKQNHLTVLVIFRSWDLYAGFPENMGGFALLNQYVASELDICPGPLAFVSDGLHCYDYQIEPLRALLNKE